MSIVGCHSLNACSIPSIIAKLRNFWNYMFPTKKWVESLITKKHSANLISLYTYISFAILLVSFALQHYFWPETTVSLETKQYFMPVIFIQKSLHIIDPSILLAQKLLVIKFSKHGLSLNCLDAHKQNRPNRMFIY